MVFLAANFSLQLGHLFSAVHFKTLQTSRPRYNKEVKSECGGDKTVTLTK